MSYSVINNIDLKMSIMLPKKEKDNSDFIILHQLDDEHKLDNKTNLIPENNNIYCEQIIYVNFEHFLKDIRDSFKNIDDIRKQFDLDISRCCVYINKHKIEDRGNFQQYLYKHFDSNLANNILMLTTQALMGLPFEAIYKNIPDGYCLCELDRSCEQKPYRISIIVEKKSIEFKAYKEFRIIKIKEEDVENVCKLSVKLEFDMNKSNDLLITINIINVDE